MKKILLFVAGLMLAMSASALDVYVRGNGNWGTPSAEMKFTDNGDGTYTLNQSFELQSSFKVATADWAEVNCGNGGDDAKIGTIAIYNNGSSSDIKVPVVLNVTKMILDTNNNTLTIEGTEAGAIQITSWTIAGYPELLGAEWDPAAEANVMTEKSAGVFELVKKGVTLAAGDYEYKACANKAWSISEVPASGNQTLTIDADGTYDLTFTLTVNEGYLEAVATPATPTAIDEADAEDAVVAAFDLLGRPVAADAAGYVILQYASGKSAKVFNN
jgi:hypothetical protein